MEGGSEKREGERLVREGEGKRAEEEGREGGRQKEGEEEEMVKLR